MAWHPFRNFGLKLTALALGTALWFTVSGPQVERNVTGVPVTYRNVPVSMEITGQTEAVDVHVRGIASQISQIQPYQMSVVVDLAGRQPGWLELPVRADQIIAPIGVEVAQVEPNVVTLRLEQADIGERTLEGTVVTARNLAPGRQFQVDPQTVSVTVRGSRAMLARLDPATVTAYVDVVGLSPGRHQLPVRAEVGGTLTTLALRPATASVLIR
jgi:YbbR domain-containing protein